MTFRFLNFPVYKDSKIFYKDILNTISHFPKEEKYNLTDQLRRAGLSIILNIAEGCDKGTDPDFNRYLMIALGSLNEVVAGIDIAFEDKYIDENNYKRLMGQAEKLSKQFGGFSRKLRS
jgi:four helix bundle protein